jgi:hypothetical protein
MNTKDLLKLAASAPIALASSGTAYVAASGETDSKVEAVETKLNEAITVMDSLKKINEAYLYKLQKAENELAIMKANSKK